LARVLVEPSPKVQLYVKGAVPPVTLDVKVIVCPKIGEEGVKVKSTASLAETVMV
jgi:hypothetical protein